MAQLTNELNNSAEGSLRTAPAPNAKAVIKKPTSKRDREGAKWMGGNITVMSPPERIQSVLAT